MCLRTFSHCFSPGRIPILRQVYDRGASNRDVRDRTCNFFATPTRVHRVLSEKKGIRRGGEWPSLICGMCMITIDCAWNDLFDNAGNSAKTVARLWKNESNFFLFSLSLSLSLLYSKMYGIFALSERTLEMILYWLPGDISWWFLARHICKVLGILENVLSAIHEVSNFLWDTWLCCRYFPQCDTVTSIRKRGIRFQFVSYKQRKIYL